MFESASQEAVKLELVNVRKRMAYKLCPVFKERCKGTECMSYADGQAVVFRKRVNPGETPPKWEDWYRPHEPRCNSTFVTGYIEAEMIAP